MFTKHNVIIRLLTAVLLCALLVLAGCETEDASDTGTGDDNGGGGGGNGNGIDYDNPPDISYVAGQQMTLDHVDGLLDDTSIVTGEPITFHIRLNNNTGSALTGLTNGFVVYSFENAARWDTAYGMFTSNVTASMFDGGRFIPPQFIGDGANVDTIAFGGYNIQGTGIPAGFDDIAFTIQIGPIDAAYHGRWICLDSSYYPPGGPWLWPFDGGSVNPDWDGARWFRIVDTTSN
ncbi:MAG: hypothetical protein KOO62_04425 [candidate division Zixibacteria bacterium]|nr:hypothetical protein [candidate division Zixibacteria bacterium]